MTQEQPQVRLDDVRTAGDPSDRDRLTEAIRRAVAESVGPDETGVDPAQLRADIARAVGEVRR